MNRYEFENLISDYLEGNLSFSKRKEFESYLESNHDARSLLVMVGETLDQMKKVDKVLTSENFNSKLLSKIKDETPLIFSDKTNIFGLTPIYASIFSSLCIGVLLIGYSLIAPNFDSSLDAESSLTSNNNLQKQHKAHSLKDNINFTSDNKLDTLNVNKNGYKPKKANKIKFVNY